MMLAASQGHMAVLRYILTHSLGDISMVDNELNSALHHALQVRPADHF